MVHKYEDSLDETEWVYLPNDGETGVQVSQATRGQRGAASGELQKCLPLVRRHPTQNPDKTQEAGTGGETRGASL